MPSTDLARSAARFARTPKGLLSGVFLVLLLVAGYLTDWSQVAPHVGAAVLGAVAAELALSRRQFVWPSSAILSGLIVAFVLGPQTPWSVTFSVGALASASKHLLRTSRGHVFNPAALALLVSIPMFATGQSWWGAGGDLAWPFTVLVLASGAIVVDRINKFPLVLSFLATYFGLFTLAAFGMPGRVAEMFRPPFVEAVAFLSVFMLTDPPTSPGRFRDQVWIGILAASTATAAQMLGFGQAYLLVGLLIGNAALALQRAWRFGGIWRRAQRTA